MKKRSFPYSPSKLNLLKYCPEFINGPIGEPAKKGLAGHDLLELKALEVLEKNISPEELDWPVSFKAHGVILGFDEIEATRWGLETIFNIIRTQNLKEPIEVEQWGTIIDGDLIEWMNSKLDIACGNHVFDYKSGEIYDYYPQMCAYALQRMQTDGFDHVMIYEVYGKKKIYKDYMITREEAEKELYSIRDKCDDPNKKPVANQFCGWCAKNKTCEEVLKNVMQFPAEVNTPEGKGREFVAELLGASPESLTVDQLAILKPFADKISSWADRIKDSFRDGLISDSRRTVGDYQVSETKGDQFVSDINRAYQLSGITPVKFMGACSASLPKLALVFAKKYKISKKEARAKIENVLSEVIERKESKFRVSKKRLKNG